MIGGDAGGGDASASAQTRSQASLTTEIHALWRAVGSFVGAQGAHAALVLQAAGARLALVAVLTLVAVMVMVGAWLLIVGFALYHLALAVGWPLAVTSGVLVNIALAVVLLHAARIEMARMQGYWTLAVLATAELKTGMTSTPSGASSS